MRHALATIAYRGGKTLRGAPEGFGALSLGEGSRTAAGILAHIGDLLQWLLGLADGEHRWSDTSPDDRETQVERFHAELAILDERLASDEPLRRSVTRLFQGPVADALQHIGQLAMMRRLAGSPVGGENFYKAEIEIGRVGAEQAPPVYEFDRRVSAPGRNDAQLLQVDAETLAPTGMRVWHAPLVVGDVRSGHSSL